MIVEKARFTALIEAHLAADPAASAKAGRPANEAERAAQVLGELVRRPGLMIEVLPDDLLAWLADWQGPAMDVRIFEASAARSVGVGDNLDAWLRQARAVVIEVAGGPDLPLHEVSETAERLYAWLPADVDVVFGASVDEALRGQVAVRIVALGQAG